MSLNSPTKEEQRWLDAITDLGCVVCIVEGLGPTPAEPHHMLSGGRRMGHRFTIPLCYSHHRSGRNDAQVVSRDHNQSRFEARYGPELQLLEKTRTLVVLSGYTVSSAGTTAKPDLVLVQGGNGTNPKCAGIANDSTG